MLPTDIGGSSTSSSAVTATLSRPFAYALLAGIVGTATDVLGIGTNVKLALCSAIPSINVSTGEWNISAVELTSGTAPGYARASINRQGQFAAPAGAGSSAHSDSTVQVTWPKATANWPVATYVAVLNNAGTKVIAVFELDAGIAVQSGNQARVPVAGLRWTIPTT